ncbi:MAG: hypothetical protein GY879_10575, partial [Planctomycetes bacterium]|nr:hypothetical protein [Planctomycetota bacterium]
MFNKLLPLLFVLGLAAHLPAQSTWYVPDDFTTIQAGIDGSSNGDAVIVRDGTYVENIDFNGKAITLKSENGPATTIIDGNQAGSVVTIANGEGSDSVFEGFTVTNGNDIFGGGALCYNSSPTLENCIFTSNTANDGGGGMQCTVSSPTLTNCTFADNTATRYGGGMQCGSSSAPTLTNCTFTNNTAGIGGGGMLCNEHSSPTLTNCILWDNHAPNGPEICVITGTVTVTYSNVKGGWTGTGNID